MDIKELEFIRDFQDLVGNLQVDIANVAMAMDEGAEDDKIKEVSLTSVNFLWSIVHQVESLEKVLQGFKEQIDDKYFHVWQQKHPHMTKEDRDSEKIF